jgi:hypothetical protein
MIRNKMNVFHLVIQVVVEQLIDLFDKTDVKNYVKNQLRTFKNLFSFYLKK